LLATPRTAPASRRLGHSSAWWLGCAFLWWAIATSAAGCGSASRDAASRDAASRDAVSVDAGQDVAEVVDENGNQDVTGSDAATPPSCSPDGPGRTNCGALHESCCTSPLVMGGTFSRTYTSDGTAATGLADPATITSFRLDKYDVTVGRFRQFVAAWNDGAGYTPPSGSGKHAHLNGGRGLEDSVASGFYETGWLPSDDGNIAPTDANLASCGFDEWTDTTGGDELRPMSCVSWYEAYAFCIWDGGFLPSEAEWEYAAAGGSQQREYPWGTTAPGTTNQYAIYGCNYPSGTANCTDVSNIAPVGTATSGAGLLGHLDLAGNVWQWNLDWSAPYSGGTDCAYLTGASSRVLRGGNFSVYGGTSYLLPPVRNDDSPSDRSYDSGFRCARTP
jgi:sulfatase modifying factor 1